jgi:hypothetical protein
MREDRRQFLLAAGGLGIGGGIFAVLGQLTRGGTPAAFLIARIVAVVTAYSHARFSFANVRTASPTDSRW